jgi:hypothetical protein
VELGILSVLAGAGHDGVDDVLCFFDERHHSADAGRGEFVYQVLGGACSHVAGVVGPHEAVVVLRLQPVDIISKHIVNFNILLERWTQTTI